MSQSDQILKYLQEYDHITQLEAIGLYRCFRLAARILDLRKKGHVIETENRRDTTGKPYARYRLVKLAEAA